jgi:hypothetical protein
MALARVVVAARVAGVPQTLQKAAVVSEPQFEQYMAPS